MFKKIISLTGMIVLTFIFGLGIASLLPVDVDAGNAPPDIEIPKCELHACYTISYEGCQPNAYRDVVYSEEYMNFSGEWTGTCCGEIISISGCHYPN